MADYAMDADNCTGCNDMYEFCQLTDYLISDIQQLESEVVHLRYALSGYLSKQDGEMLRCDYPLRSGWQVLLAHSLPAIYIEIQ